MGTRNLTMVVSNNQTKVAQYGQWDGYPEGQGRTALEILTNILKEGKLPEFKEKVDKLTWLTKEQGEDLEKDKNLDLKHPYLSRDWGAQILEAVIYGTLTKEPGFMQSQKLVYAFDILGLVDSSSFAKDSLFCEWGYVIDLDKMTFEVYEGFNKSPLAESERFYPMQVTMIETANANNKEVDYYPIRHIKTYDLNALPTLKQFLEDCTPKDEDGDDN
jgi:hypothetical protein